VCHGTPAARYIGVAIGLDDAQARGLVRHQHVALLCTGAGSQAMIDRFVCSVALTYQHRFAARVLHLFDQAIVQQQVQHQLHQNITSTHLRVSLMNSCWCWCWCWYLNILFLWLLVRAAHPANVRPDLVQRCHALMVCLVENHSNHQPDAQQIHAPTLE